MTKKKITTQTNQVKKSVPLKTKAASKTTGAKIQPMPKADDMFEKNFTVRLIQDKEIKTITDITYNETALKLLLLDVEKTLESYTLTRLSLIRTAINQDHHDNVKAKETQTINKGSNNINKDISKKLDEIKKVTVNTKHNVDDVLL